MSKKKDDFSVFTTYDYKGRVSSRTVSHGSLSETYYYDPTGSKSISERNLFRSERRRDFKTGLSILSLVFIIILAAGLLRKLSGGSSVPTFTGFLEMLTSVPDISIPFINAGIIQQLGDWGIFNFLRDFLNIFIDLLNIVVFLCNGIVQINLYVIYFLRWFFGV